MAWEIILIEEVEDWYKALDTDTIRLVTAALNLLEERGPALGRPLVDTLSGSVLSNLKELRPGPSGRSEVRILLVFDAQRQAILLTAGDKSGRWDTWYHEHIPLAEQRYALWLAGHYDGDKP